MYTYYWYYYERDFLKAGFLAREGDLFLIDVSRNREKFIEWLKDSYNPLKEGSSQFLRIIEEFDEYMEGKRKNFTISSIPHGTPFKQAVWMQTLKIPFGSVTTYGDIARAINRPGASRAVGTALKRNPLAIVIPCHRVIGANGKLGGYGGGIDLKKRLLLHEGIGVNGNFIVRNYKST
ncbi:MAG: methylated-DNA--[protein]-cysteine S-methyltransferase [Spirochaetota bacterium]